LDPDDRIKLRVDETCQATWEIGLAYKPL